VNAWLPASVAVGFAAAFGAVIGSFLNVVIWRLPRGESLLRPGSHCPGCNAPIRPWANVPILSWVFLRGRCASCGAAIPLRYPLVELATAALFAALYLRYGPDARLLATWLAGAALVAVAFIDAEHWIIPDEITLPLIPVGLAFAWLAPAPTLLEALAGVVLVGGGMWGLSLAAEWWYGHTALGMGDVKLVAMLGAFLGAEPALGVVLVGSLFGLLQALPALIAGRAGRRSRIPFGAALAAAGILHLYAPHAARSLVGSLVGALGG
jgi:leader peptidase (prepilin peptidase)/N-methyltransferase